MFKLLKTILLSMVILSLNNFDAFAESISLASAMEIDNVHFVQQESNEKYKIASHTLTNKWGIFDCESETWAIQPQFCYIDKPYSSEWCIDSMIPYICYGEDGTITIFDSVTLDLLLHFNEPKVFGWNRLLSGYVCPGILCLYQDNEVLYYSLADGSFLFNKESTDSRQIYVDGQFEYSISGYPNRLAMIIEDKVGDNYITSAYVIDLNGDSVSRQYNRITPLVWNDDEGVFLVELWDEPNIGGLGTGYTYAEGEEDYVYEGECDFGSTWRCGLVDQDGNELTEIVYKSVQIVSDYGICLGKNGIKHWYNLN